MFDYNKALKVQWISEVIEFWILEIYVGNTVEMT